jgi:DNA-binding MarR family transcriptional regulator
MAAVPIDEHLTNIVGALSLALADAVDAATADASGHTGAAPAALVALLDLLAGRSLDDLRQAIDLTHSGGVRLVDRLVADGLAQRRAGLDARSVSVVLTAKGRRLARRTQAARFAAVEGVLDVLDRSEREQLAAITEKLVGAVVAHRLDARARGELPPGGFLCRLCDPVACGRPDGACPALTVAGSRTGSA